MLETTLIFLAFAGMMLAVFDFGQFLFINESLADRARYAARWGAVHDPSDTASITDVVLYYTPTPTDNQAPFMNLRPSNIVVSTIGAGTDENRLEVKITGYRYSVFSPFIAGTYTTGDIIALAPLGTTYN